MGLDKDYKWVHYEVPANKMERVTTPTNWMLRVGAGKSGAGLAHIVSDFYLADSASCNVYVFRAELVDPFNNFRVIVFILIQIP